MATHWTGTWGGGRTYEADGRTVYVIEKMRHGRRYTTPLDVGSVREALAELALFDRDPEGYRTRRREAEQRAQEEVRLTPEHAKGFLDHLAREGRTESYRKGCKSYLAAWAEKLEGRDLRTVLLQDLRKILNEWPRARKARIITIKSFCTYLREQAAVLTPAQDPTLSLPVPPPRPGKALGERDYDLRLVERTYAATDHQAVRDALCVAAKTGLHYTELERVTSGQGTVRALDGHGEIAGVLEVPHKSGRPHLQSVDAQTLAALRRLTDRGGGPVKSFVRKELKRAAARLGTEPLKVGRFRHSFITWAEEVGVEVKPTAGGVPLATVAAVVGHKSTRTTTQFYSGKKVPVMIKLPLTLRHPEDPVALETKKPDQLAKK